MKTEDIIIRIIGFPFFFVIALIGISVLLYKYIKNYILYGGEAIAYTHKTNRKSIQDACNLLTELIKKENE